MGTIRSAMADSILTSMWVFSAPSLGVFTIIIASYLGVAARSLASLAITTALATVLVLLFSIIGDLMGGASFNPTATATLYAAGLKPSSSILSMAVRFPAQAAGAVAGAKLISHLMPDQYRFVLKGPFLKVDVHTGAVAEGVFTFVLNFALLVVFLKGPKNLLVKVWLLAMATVGLVTVGSGFTGPSMNPANAFGWAYVHGRHESWEHFYVYWVCPLLGAVLAAVLFRVLVPVVPKEEKKEKKA